MESLKEYNVSDTIQYKNSIIKCLTPVIEDYLYVDDFCITSRSNICKLLGTNWNNASEKLLIEQTQTVSGSPKAKHDEYISVNREKFAMTLSLNLKI